MQKIQVNRVLPTLPHAVLDVLPPGLCDAIIHCGAPVIEEIRLHSERYTCVSGYGQNYLTQIVLHKDDLADILKRMCQGSLYAYGRTINQGYLSMGDGIRVGVCGSAAVENGQIIGVNDVTGLILRIPHFREVEHDDVIRHLFHNGKLSGLLIFSPPGGGKTTLLRSIAATLASTTYSLRTVVVDTREEFGFGLSGKELNLDILSGYPRKEGIEIAVRSLGAQVVICDEIGSTEDAYAILNAANCGVPLIASTHASGIQEMLLRPPLQRLHTAHVFDYYLGVQRCSNGGFAYHFYERDTQESNKNFTGGFQCSP